MYTVTNRPLLERLIVFGSTSMVAETVAGLSANRKLSMVNGNSLGEMTRTEATGCVDAAVSVRSEPNSRGPHLGSTGYRYSCVVPTSIPALFRSWRRM